MPQVGSSQQIKPYIMLPPLIGGGIKRCFCLTSICLTSVCLSVAYIGRNSRTERPRKTKIGTEVARPCHTRLGHHFQGQKVKGHQAALVGCTGLAGQHGHTVMVTYPYAYLTYSVSPFAGLPRAGSGVIRIDPLRFLAGCRTRRLNQV